jgi:hypothetical protein
MSCVGSTLMVGSIVLLRHTARDARLAVRLPVLLSQLALGIHAAKTAMDGVAWMVIACSMDWSIMMSALRSFAAVLSRRSGRGP